MPVTVLPLHLQRLHTLNCRPKLVLLYKAVFATYTSSALMLLVWETRRKDFYAMLAHHTATVGLIGLSFYLG